MKAITITVTDASGMEYATFKQSQAGRWFDEDADALPQPLANAATAFIEAIADTDRNFAAGPNR